MEPFAIPGEVLAGGFVAAGLTAFGWLIRLALGETLKGLQSSLADLRKSVDGLTHRLDADSQRIADHDMRLAVVEDRLKRIGQ